MDGRKAHWMCCPSFLQTLSARSRKGRRGRGGLALVASSRQAWCLLWSLPGAFSDTSRSSWKLWGGIPRSQIDENIGVGGFGNRWKVRGDVRFTTKAVWKAPGGIGLTKICCLRTRGGVGITHIVRRRAPEGGGLSKKVFWRAPGGAGTTKIMFWRAPGGAGTTKIVFWRAPGGAGTTKIMVSATPWNATPLSGWPSSSYAGPHQSIHFLYDSHSENGILRD